MRNIQSINCLYQQVLLVGTLVLVGAGCGGGSEKEITPLTPITPITPTTPSGTLDNQFTLWLTDLSNKVILPNYQTLETKATQFSDSGKAFCQLDNAKASDLTELKVAWQELNLAWQSIQWLKIGPILQHNRNFRIQLWPDSRGYVARDVENFLLTQTTLDADAVAKSSVSGQGVPALEYLLYPATNQDSLLNASNKIKRCEVMVAVSDNVTTISGEVLEAWQATGGNYIAQVIGGTGEFTGVKDAVEEIVTNWLEQVERVKDEKMLQPFALNAPGSPSITEFYLSEQSLVSIKANVLSFQQIYSAGGGYSLEKILVEFLGQQTIAIQMNDRLTAAITATEDLSGLYAELLSSDEGRVIIDNNIQKLRELRDILSIDFIQATDINIGFNSNDGD
ncbi:imelysin family protein [Colwellia hornerae]|uniref:Imelysin family protein n=1 Tax=Colwellia hornerae TaxID=89402 RepID=A0A5C6Q2H3_9GAMM|nr:imelysin family protein [Colwellia hornerae]TWX46380.1 imelysin family protein [Colwellia hornerae]TWX54189.1 imelysin family protein [Colwellia hornerae]TWX63095.1 imelysin family protein [Colwellia hornerae]